MDSGTIAVSEASLKWEAEHEEQLFADLQEREFAWNYSQLEEGDVVIIGRDCVYGSFRYVLR